MAGPKLPPATSTESSASATAMWPKRLAADGGNWVQVPVRGSNRSALLSAEPPIVPRLLNPPISTSRPSESRAMAAPRCGRGSWAGAVQVSVPGS